MQHYTMMLKKQTAHGKTLQVCCLPIKTCKGAAGKRSREQDPVREKKARSPIEGHTANKEIIDTVVKWAMAGERQRPRERGRAGKR
jgi:hypothetical protein